MQQIIMYLIANKNNFLFVHNKKRKIHSFIKYFTEIEQHILFFYEKHKKEIHTSCSKNIDTNVK